jgi:hypothetical protein
MVNKTVIIVEPGKQEILITKEVNATLYLVVKDFTDSKLYGQLLEPRRFTKT